MATLANNLFQAFPHFGPEHRRWSTTRPPGATEEKKKKKKENNVSESHYFKRVRV
jgi:hypothetical protein